MSKNINKVYRSKKPVIAVCVVAGVLLIGASLFFGIKGLKSALDVNDISTGMKNGALTEEDYKKHPYLRDVRYTGPVKYMELFDYKFGKSKMYMMNKDLDAEIYDTALTANTAKTFIEDLYTIDYRDLIAGTKEYQDKINAYISPETVFFSDAGPVISKDDGLDEFIELIATDHVERSVSSKAAFITDPELVYTDGYTYCRGVIEYEEFGSDDDNTIKCTPVEVALFRNPEGDRPYVVGIFPVIDQDTNTIYEKFTVEKDKTDAT